MLQETGRVESVSEGFAWVVCASQSNCQRCREGRGCGGGLLGRLLGDRLHRVRAVTNGQTLIIGDRVELALSEAALVRGAVRVYGLPLAGFLLLPIAARWLFGLSGDFSLLALGAVGLLAGLTLARRHGAQVARDPQFQPVITRRLASICGTTATAGGAQHESS